MQKFLISSKSTKKLLILLVLMSFQSWASVENFEKEMSLCITPHSYACDKSSSVSIDGSSFYAEFDVKSVDEGNNSVEYTVEFRNRSRCKVTIGSTLFKHGSKVSTLDIGNINIEPRDSRTSRVNTLYFSERASDGLDFMIFRFHGLANCPD